MFEHLGGNERAEEFAREKALESVINQYFPDDAEFLSDFDLEDRIMAVYGQLIEAGEDPDIVLIESGVLEGQDEV